MWGNSELHSWGATWAAEVHGHIGALDLRRQRLFQLYHGRFGGAVGRAAGGGVAAAAGAVQQEELAGQKGGQRGGAKCQSGVMARAQCGQAGGALPSA